MKKISTFLGFIALCVFLQSNVKSVKNSGVPPTGNTGALGSYCTTSGCHDGNKLNPDAGKVTVTGLPTGTYTPGKAYPFTLTITTPTSRKIWGFSISASSYMDSTIGVFSCSNTTNHAAPNPDGGGQLDELSHNNAVSKTATTYTYTNLVWTAPAQAKQTIKFYYVGLAGMKTGAPGNGDFVYAGSSILALPINLASFTANAQTNAVKLDWASSSEENSSFYDIQKSDDGQVYYSVGKLFSKGTAATYSFVDKRISFYNRPVYYRLRLVDKNGSEKYSKVVTISVSNATIKSFVSNVYPTLLVVNHPINATIESDKEQSLEIVFFDASGKVVEKFNKLLVKGTNNVSFQLSASPARGMAFAKFITGSNQQTVPVFISK